MGRKATGSPLDRRVAERARGGLSQFGDQKSMSEPDLIDYFIVVILIVALGSIGGEILAWLV